MLPEQVADRAVQQVGALVAVPVADRAAEPVADRAVVSVVA